MTDSAQRLSPRVLTVIWLVLAAAVLVLRVYECTQLPAHTGDIMRHIYYGLLVVDHGLSAAGQPLIHYRPSYAVVAWSELPYQYPVLTLLFFTAAAWISPTLFFARLGLTAVEAANAVLVGVISRDRWLALIYWALPSSIWWISREGQFEALQNLFVFLAFLLLKRQPLPACAALALAVQVKLTAILLVPLVAWLAWRSLRADVWKAAVAFLVGFAPSAVALMWYPALTQLGYSAPLSYNPYYWNVFAADIFAWLPQWLIWANVLSSWGMIALLAFGLVAFRERRLAYVAPLLFLFVCKVHNNVQFWYMCLLPSFVLPIREAGFRRRLFLLSPFLDLYAVALLIADRALYFGLDRYFDAMTAFTPFRLH